MINIGCGNNAGIFRRRFGSGEGGYPSKQVKSGNTNSGMTVEKVFPLQARCGPEGG